MSVRASSVLFVAVSALGLSDCDKPDAAAAMASNLAAACASPETLAALKTAILSEIQLPVSGAGAQSYKDQIIAGAELTIAGPVVTAFDKPTSRLSCSGEARFVWPKDLAGRLASLSPDADWTSDKSAIAYTIQAKAAGGGFDYAVQTGGAEITGMAQSMIAALYQSDAKAAQAAAPQPSVAAPAPNNGGPANPGPSSPEVTTDRASQSAASPNSSASSAPR